MSTKWSKYRDQSMIIYYILGIIVFMIFLITILDTLGFFDGIREFFSSLSGGWINLWNIIK